MTRVIYIRHGESEANLLRLFAGQKDFPLTACGQRQAEKIATHLKENYLIDMIFSSDLCRALQTAAPTAKAFGLEIIPVSDLRERGVGIWEGLSHKEILETDGEELLAARAENRSPNPEGSEPISALHQRVYKAEDEILARSKGKCVAVFSHTCVMHTMARRWQESLPKTDFVFENASISVVDYDDGGSVVAIPVLNFQGHLGEDVTFAPKHLF